MYAERATLVVDYSDLTRAFAKAVFSAAGGGDPGPLADDMRVLSIETIDEDNVRVTLIHRDLYQGCEATVDTHDTRLRSVS